MRVDMKNNRWKIVAGIIVICLLAIYPCFRLIQHKETYKLPKEGYQIINSQKITRAKGTVLVMDEERGAMMQSPHQTIPGTPIYTMDEARLTLPVSYAIVYPDKSGKMYRLNYFTQIYRKNHLCYASFGNKETIIGDGFLFDGKDTYLFLEETVIKVGKKKVTLSPLSFATVVYGQKGMAYDYETKVGIVIPANAGSITAYYGNGKTIHLDTDILKSQDEQQLLFGKPEKLKELD